MHIKDTAWIHVNIWDFHFQWNSGQFVLKQFSWKIWETNRNTALWHHWPRCGLSLTAASQWPISLQEVARPQAGSGDTKVVNETLMRLLSNSRRNWTQVTNSLWTFQSAQHSSMGRRMSRMVAKRAGWHCFLVGSSMAWNLGLNQPCTPLSCKKFVAFWLCGFAYACAGLQSNTGYVARVSVLCDECTNTPTSQRTACTNTESRTAPECRVSFAQVLGNGIFPALRLDSAGWEETDFVLFLA